ncbi:MAG: NUDIX hydrolase [Beijerinckiaceae bacterium]|nr:NUDIX hydrolase [Beijerinckiaceae bacterium]
MKSKLQPGDFSYRAQVAALPIRVGRAGDIEVLLISSRETRRWIIPKGWPMKGRKDHQAAAKEALEEAGVIGKVRKHPIGGYTYQKRLNDRVQPCRVMVYRLDVEHELEAWPEKNQRERQWFPAGAAADSVSEPRLASMIRRLGHDANDDQGPIAKSSAAGSSGLV